MAGALAVGGCATALPVTVSPPTGRAPQACDRLQDALPDEVVEGRRRDTEPASGRTAAWGDPPVVLRCGVPRPAGLAPTSQLIEVEGVDWFLSERPRAFVFTTVGRETYVEVRVPGSTPRAAATAPLVDVAAAIKSAVKPSEQR